MEEIKNRVLECIIFVENENYLSYDVFDALNSSFIDRLLKSNVFLRRVVIQLNAHLPFNFRPFFGNKKMIHTKTISDMLSIYTIMYKKTGDFGYKQKAKEMFDLLWSRRIMINNCHGWGLNFPYATRFVNADKCTPNLYNTINALHSILDYYDINDEININNIIDGVINLELNYLGMVNESDYMAWLRYYPKQVGMPTPNVNATSASLFVRINSILGYERIDRKLIVKLLNFVSFTQNNDGSWYYTTNEKGKWIDGFHTGFILESLSLIKHLDSSYDINAMLKKGVDYFLKNLIENGMIPKYYNNRTYPIEAQNCAQCIQTLAKLIINDKLNVKIELMNTVRFVLDVLYDKEGFFYYKKEKYYTNRQFYMRWSQTPMILSLLNVLEAQHH